MIQQKSPSRLVNVSEAATFLRVSRSKLYMLMASGELAYVKLGKSRRLPMSELMLLIKRNTHSGYSEGK